MFISFCIRLIFHSLQFTFPCFKQTANHQGRHVEKNISETWVAPTHLEWWMLVPAIFQALVHPRRLTAGTYKIYKSPIFLYDLNQTSMLMFRSLIFRGVLRRSLEDVKYLPKKKIPFIPYFDFAHSWYNMICITSALLASWALGRSVFKRSQVPNNMLYNL